MRVNGVRVQQVDKIMIGLVHGVNLLQKVFQLSIARPCNTSHGQVASPGALNAGRARLFIAAPLIVRLLPDPVLILGGSLAGKEATDAIEEQADDAKHEADDPVANAWNIVGGSGIENHDSPHAPKE